MLEHTFIHIQGIGPKTEQKIWRQGIHTWGQFLSHKRPVISLTRDPMIRAQLETSLENRANIGFFSDRLSVSEQWRLFDEFKERVVYLDIETSGGYPGMDEITVIGLYDGQEVRTFVNGHNLEGFEIEIASYKLIITFNGSSFDLPFIRRHFPGITLPPGHIDLRFFLKKLGYRGGLKTIEKEFGLERDSDIDGMDGFEAVRLWRAYQWGDQKALDLLIQYNTADIVNLKTLMETGYDQMKSRLLSQ
ncbi:MAG: ribonuclease H-like domain-containing protein [Deltaproteobacteria bacterium]|nr:ribonuclease H-like domain-containing protein [Deltaproteobacteria bacterium]